MCPTFEHTNALTYKLITAGPIAFIEPFSEPKHNATPTASYRASPIELPSPTFRVVPHASTSEQPWDIPADEKRQSDHLFGQLDTRGVGWLDAQSVTPFLLAETALSRESLERVWQLVDTERSGRLTRDQFAVLMHITEDLLSGHPLPAQLPATLIPPSMRRGPGPTSATPPVGGFTKSLPSEPPYIQPASPWATHMPEPHPSQVTNAPWPGAAAPTEISNTRTELDSTIVRLNSTRRDREHAERELGRGTDELAALQAQLASAKEALEDETRRLASAMRRRAEQIETTAQVREQLSQVERQLATVRLDSATGSGNVRRNDTWHARPVSEAVSPALRQSQSQRVSSNAAGGNRIVSPPPVPPLQIRPLSIATGPPAPPPPRSHARPMSVVDRPASVVSDNVRSPLVATQPVASSSTSTPAPAVPAVFERRDSETGTDEPPPAYQAW